MDSPAIAIIGPTASGKSTLGFELARIFSGEIVTCDALQVYREMDIGTAKPNATERSLVPHHLIDIRDPNEEFCAGDYMRLAREALAAIQTRGRIPFVVGGTGFYFRALIEGLFAGPGRSESLRSRLRRIVAARGPEAIHRILQHIDPETAARLAPADAERNIRAYEIFRISGKTMSWWQSRPRDDLKGYRWLKLGIAWPRTLLYERIDRRAEEMVRKGFVAEVRQLAARLSRDCQAFKAIGYRQVLAYLDGVWSLEEAVEDMQRESRRYAKRQTTWFRSDTDILWLDPASGAEALQRQAAERIDAFLTDASFRTSRL